MATGMLAPARLACGLLLSAALAGASAAQNGSSPLDPPSSRQTARPEPGIADDRPYLAPMSPASRWQPSQPPPSDRARADPSPPPSARPAPTFAAPVAVERSELTPVMAADGSDLWRGLDVAELERLMAGLAIPPRSEALHWLWHRLVTSRVTPPGGAERTSHFEALRMEALYRTGAVAEIAAATERSPGTADDPLIALIAARSRIGLGDREGGCDQARTAMAGRSAIPASLRGEAVLVSGYCAASRQDVAAAGLAAELAREEGSVAAGSLAILDSIALGEKPRVDASQRLSLLDYRLLQIGGTTADTAIVERAEPALLAVLAADGGLPAQVRLAAAEAAARINVLDAAALAGVYRESTGERVMSDADAPDRDADGPARRAALLVTFERERTPLQKVRQMRSFLDSARRNGLYLPALVLVAEASRDLAPAPEIGWFAETAIEASLAARDYPRARAWVDFAGTLDGGQATRLEHWLALADIADSAPEVRRGMALASVEQMALDGRFGADQLHRLATVLDALDYHVPIPLWEAASRTPQPAGGHLPETGVLSRLQDAAKKREFGRTVLLAMRSLGPEGAESAHMIALGDAIRALKRAGLEADARRIAFEALFARWPRVVTN